MAAITRLGGYGGPYGLVGSHEGYAEGGEENGGGEGGDPFSDYIQEAAASPGATLPQQEGGRSRHKGDKR